MIFERGIEANPEKISAIMNMSPPKSAKEENREHQPVYYVSKMLQGVESKNIICYFGIPRAIISDNRTQISGNKLKDWCKGLTIKQFFKLVSNPQANGETEVTNRIILQHLKTRLGTAKGAWDELSSVLCAYRTTPRTPTGEFPFNLSCGTDAVVKQYNPDCNEQGLSQENFSLLEVPIAPGPLIEIPLRSTPSDVVPGEFCHP
ncbi:UNVERIFIED_CONTAM: hypothetical protein Sindi_2887600 [Sesamum indicum]